jgi:hypothetical protein
MTAGQISRSVGRVPRRRYVVLSTCSSVCCDWTMRSDVSASDAPGAELLELAAMAARLGTQDLRAALRSVTDAGVNLTGAEYGAFFYSGEDEQGGRLDLYVLSGAAAGAFPDEVPVRHTALFAPTFSGHGVVRVADVLTDPRYGGNRSVGIPPSHLVVRSYLAVPIVTPEGRVLGALLFGHRQADRFDDRAEVAAQAVAAHAATAAENARLLGAAHRARDQAEGTARRLELLQHITALLSNAASTAEITSRVPAAVTAALGCSGSHLMLVDDVHQELVGAPSAALPPHTRQAFSRVPLTVRTPSTQAALTGSAVLAVGDELLRFEGLPGRHRAGPAARKETRQVAAALVPPVEGPARRRPSCRSATETVRASLGP